MIMASMGKKKDARSLYYTGRQHLDMKRFKKAIKTYRQYLEVIKKEKKTPGRTAEKRKVRFDLAKALYQRGAYKKAIKVLDEEDLKEYFFLKGQIHSMEGDHGEAIKVLLKAHITEETKKGFFPVMDIEHQIWDFLSVSLSRMEQYEMAYTAAQKALEWKDSEQVRSNAKVFAHRFKAIKEKDKGYYNRLFKDGYDTSRYNDIYEIILRMLAEIEDPNILEVGCGVGTLGIEDSTLVRRQLSSARS
jgi:tetratricopeptide (TPR) repeat protein